MYVLGLTHPISWNGAAALIKDGVLIAMVEEERINRIKHAPQMAPELAMQYCLDYAGITLDQVDYVAVGFDKALKAALGNFQSDSFFSALNQAVIWLQKVSPFDRRLPLGNYDKNRVHFIDHHLSHAASTFYASGFDAANILSLDGSGGTKSGILATGNGISIEVLENVSNRGSWGLIYEEITEKLGFRRHSGEGKVMGLAAYGAPDPAGLPCINWDGKIPVIDPGARKRYVDSLPTRKSEEPLTDYHKNLAATLQDSLERVGARMVEYLYEKTGYRKLCLAGGTALNCSMNGKLANLPFVDEIYIQPASHDAGTAFGAALQLYVEKTGTRPDWKMDHAYWGPEYSNEEIEADLKTFGDRIRYKKSENIFADTAQLLHEGRIVGWFQGRMEIGPRALGNRSILGNPQIKDMKDRINNLVKHREPWRPFAPSMMEEHALRYLDQDIPSPFMILAFDTKKESMDEIVSATHVDGTCRPQTVSKRTNPRYWNLINEFYKITDIPVVLNTSFNVAGQPIVNTPAQAVDTFLNCGMEMLAIGDYLVSK